MSHGEKPEVESNEIELSTEELMGLSYSCDSATSQAPQSSGSTRPTQTKAATLRMGRATSRQYAALGAAVLVVATGGIYALQRNSSPGGVRALQWTPLPDKEPEVIEEPEPVGNSKPVLIRNAFDEKEVFEFPAGTTEQEARDAAAEILLKRAVERQSNLGRATPISADRAMGHIRS